MNEGPTDAIRQGGVLSRAAARHLVLRRLLEQGGIASQEVFVEQLKRAGHPVTQTTVSRDLTALGARRVVVDGVPRYVLDEQTAPAGSAFTALAELMRTFVVRIEHSGNLVVIKTMPAAAHPVAAAIDALIDGGARGVDEEGVPVSPDLESKMRNDIVATVAGDDTVLAVTRTGDGGAHAARHFEDIVENYA